MEQHHCSEPSREPKRNKTPYEKLRIYATYSNPKRSSKQRQRQRQRDDRKAWTCDIGYNSITLALPTAAAAATAAWTVSEWILLFFSIAIPI